MLEHCLSNNIYLAVIKNIYISVFYLSMYLSVFIYLFIFYFLKLLIFVMRTTLEISALLYALVCLSSVMLYICLFFLLLNCV